MHTHPHLRQIALRYRALSNERRLRILELLSHSHLTGILLVKELDIGPPSVSRHLLILSRARLIEGKRKGKEVFFQISDNVNVKQMLGDKRRSGYVDMGTAIQFAKCRIV